MSRLENPFKLTPARAGEFVGRREILARWRERLSPGSESWNDALSWLVVGSGGVGKTSLLFEMRRLAETEFGSQVVYLDLGHYRQLDRDEDFFNFLDSYLPAKKASTRLRQWFDLPVDAKDRQVATKLLSNFSLTLPINIGGFGAEFDLSFLDNETKRPPGFVERLVQAFNTLAILSEEQERPVVLLIDQVGKIHDSYRWLLVGYQFLQLAERIRDYKSHNIVCVFSLRPERKGVLEHELEHYLRTPLFKQSVYQVEHLRPLGRQEAVWIITERAKGKGWDHAIAGKIADALNAEVGIDPYHVVLGASAVWEHLYREEEHRRPEDLDEEAVREIVRQGHGYLLDRVKRHSPIQWVVLSLLAFHPAGLTMEDITEKSSDPRKNLSLPDVETVVAELSNKAGYRLINEISNATSIRYTLAHDILREHILQHLPSDLRRREEVQKLLDDGVWRYKYSLNRTPFNQQDFELLWQYHTFLLFGSSSWEAIIESDLSLSEPQLLRWAAEFPQDIRAALINIDRPINETLLHFRYHLIRAYVSPTIKIIDGILSLLVQNAQEDSMRYLTSIETLGQLGEQSMSLLMELAQNAKNEWERIEAVRVLEQFGESTLFLMINLTQNANDELVQVEAAKVLGKLDQRKVPLSVIGRLAENTKDESVRLEAAKVLGQFGEREFALSIFSDLAQKGEYESTYLEVIEALKQFGEPALTVLRNIAQKGKGLSVRRRAAEAMGEFGELALNLMIELGKNTEDEPVRLEVAKVLGQFGEREFALSMLRVLSQNAKDELVRLEAVKVLGQFGEREFALSMLMKLAQNVEPKWMRQRVAEILWQFGERYDALSILTELAQNGEPKWMRTQAVTIMGQLGELALPTLVDLVQNTKDETVRLEAAKILWRFDKRSVALFVLTDLVENGDLSVRWQAATVLVELGEREIILPILNKLAQNVEPKWMRTQAVTIMGQLGELALPALVDLAQNANDESVRLEAAKILEQLGKRDVAIFVLSDLAKSTNDESVRLKTTKLLGQFGEPDVALSILNEVLQSTKAESVRLHAAQAMGQFGKRDIVLSVLNELAQNGTDKKVRLQAAQTLGQFGELDIPLSVLSELAKNAKDELIRRMVAEALVQFDKAALPTLLSISWRGIGNEAAEIAAWHLMLILKRQLLG